MRDYDLPKCPACARKLKPAGQRSRPGTTKADWDHIAEKLWRCAGCKLIWSDRMDGSEMTVCPKKRRGGTQQ